MAPSTVKLEAKLRSTIEQVYKENPELLTVKKIRDRVQTELGLEDNFFTSPEWKDKSKALIKDHAQKLIDGAEELPESVEVKPRQNPAKAAPAPAPKKKAIAPTKKATKRVSSEEESRPKKRQKKAATPSDIPSEDSSLDLPSEDSAVSAFNDSDDSNAPKAKRGKAKTRAPARRTSKKSKVVDSDESEAGSEESRDDSLDDDDENDSDASPPPKKKPKKAKKSAPTKSKSKHKVVESDEESDNVSPAEDDPSEDEKVAPVKKKTPKNVSAEHKSSFTKQSLPDEDQTGSKANDSDSSEMSVVLDEAPKPKRRRKSKDPSSKAPKPKKETKDLAPTEVQIKTLQSQLVKCGVRKIWAFELKKCEDDQEKIRHLQGMLKDIGMTGRFSDQRAKEIKEMRELQADLDAVKEGESAWGLGSGTRKSRAAAQRKSLKEDTDEDEDEEGSEEGGSPSVSEKPLDRAEKIAKAKADLAFLGDESDSD
ncbi:hypothetical protein B0O99DRAFT_633719 [Bisporella sp. PMI_857]|nr:hypothetical protein B0O99DRAFT_633719 [Bisporella sp. PMI_857]